MRTRHPAAGWRRIPILLDWFSIAIVSGASPALFMFFRATTTDQWQVVVTTGSPEVP